MFIDNDQLNIIIRGLVTHAIQKEKELNEERDHAISRINFVNGITRTSAPSSKSEILDIEEFGSRNLSDSKIKKGQNAGKSLTYTHEETLKKQGVKREKYNINTPKNKERLIAMGLSEKQANIVIHKACELKANHDHGVKSLTKKKKYRIHGRNAENKVCLTVKRKNNTVFNEDTYTKEIAESYATKAIDRRNNLRHAVRCRVAKKSELEKLDLSHGTLEIKINSEFSKHVKGTQKVSKRSSAPNVKFNKES